MATLWQWSSITRGVFQRKSLRFSTVVLISPPSRYSAVCIPSAVMTEKQEKSEKERYKRLWLDDRVRKLTLVFVHQLVIAPLLGRNLGIEVLDHLPKLLQFLIFCGQAWRAASWAALSSLISPRSCSSSSSLAVKTLVEASEAVFRSEISLSRAEKARGR